MVEKLKKVYIETSVLSRILDLRVKPVTLQAFNAICDFDNIELVTSEKALKEFIKTQNQDKRIALKLLYKLMLKVPTSDSCTVVSATYGGFTYGSVPYGGSSTIPDPLLGQLRALFDQDDADHIFQAIKSKCDFFLTLDYSTILDRIQLPDAEYQNICKYIKFVDPCGLVALVGQK